MEKYSGITLTFYFIYLFNVFLVFTILPFDDANWHLGSNSPDLITTFHNIFQVSLMMTIVGLAQNFVGSNNLNLLQPLGQFGTRLHGGKDSASPRYIFTMLRSVPAIHVLQKTIRSDWTFVFSMIHLSVSVLSALSLALYFLPWTTTY